MIYFDNSATTIFKPDCVIGAVNTTMRFLSANAGRSGHSMSLKCAQMVSLARNRLARFVGAKENANVIFTPNCSHALSLAIFGYLKPNSHVITTCYEHNSVLRPLYHLSQTQNCKVSIINSSSSLAQSVEKAINPNTSLVIVNHVSNVSGEIQNVQEVGAVCKKYGVKFLVDGAQSVGYLDVDMQKSNIDMLAVAPHKGLHAIQGVGALVVGRNVSLSSVVYGGTGTHSQSLVQPIQIPEGFEVGTLPLPAISSLIPAIEWCEKHKIEHRKHLAMLSDFLFAELAIVPKLKIRSPQNCHNGIIAFEIEDKSSEDVCNYLSEKYDICARCGYHCAPLFHKTAKTEKNGLVRISCGINNTLSDCITLVEGLSEFANCKSV